jgi:hypothetical protein
LDVVRDSLHLAAFVRCGRASPHPKVDHQGHGPIMVTKKMTTEARENRTRENNEWHLVGCKKNTENRLGKRERSKRG